MSEEAPALRRVLGLPRLTAAGVGMVIGAGIYVLLGSAAADAGAAPNDDDVADAEIVDEEPGS